MILSVENGCFSYKNSKDKLLLEDINFSVEPGDLLAMARVRRLYLGV